MDLTLSAPEMAALFRQDPGTKHDGGWQSLIVGLQEKCGKENGAINLTSSDRQRIRQYAFDYGNGGWENRLVASFGRHLGPRLDGVLE